MFSRFTSRVRELSAYAVQTRYPDIDAVTDPDSVDRFCETAREIYMFVAARLPNRTAPG